MEGLGKNARGSLRAAEVLVEYAKNLSENDLFDYNDRDYSTRLNNAKKYLNKDDIESLHLSLAVSNEIIDEINILKEMDSLLEEANNIEDKIERLKQIGVSPTIYSKYTDKILEKLGKKLKE
ncbi:MAG: hypothetical protein KJ906_01095 [Nanoarchaeota archaeon]|nr:hypothetical protein [Nanoarchaeota archaeon]